MKFKVEPEIFNKWPQIRIGVLWVKGMDNSKEQAQIEKLLEAEQEKKQKELIGSDLKENPKIASWRQIYRQFGSKPNDYRSSVEALLRRVVNGKRLPKINPLVDLYNYISLKHVLPAGAENLDKVKGGIKLCFAEGNETGRLLGDENGSVSDKGEVIYKDTLGYICRKWNWREAERTKIEADSQNCVVVLEAHQGVSGEELKMAMAETKQLIIQVLGGVVEEFVLGKEKTEIELDYEPGCKLTKEDSQIAVVAKQADQNRSKVVKVVQSNVLPWDLIDKESYALKLAESLGKITGEKVEWEHPLTASHGDYATAVALKLQVTSYKLQVKEKDTPREIAEKIIAKWQAEGGVPEFVERVEAAGAGFINVWIKQSELINATERVLSEKEKFGAGEQLKGKTVLLEHTSPNPQTTIMLGHLRNNFLGMAVNNLLVSLGAKVTLDDLVNDRGVHICRSMYGYLTFINKLTGLRVNELKEFKNITDERLGEIIVGSRSGGTAIEKKGIACNAPTDWKILLNDWNNNPKDWWTPRELNLKPDHANLIWYVLGSRAYKAFPEAKIAVEEMLVVWELGGVETQNFASVPEPQIASVPGSQVASVRKLWKMILGWSQEGYAQTYKRIGSKHDHVWKESDHWQEGKDIVEEGLKKGVFKYGDVDPKNGKRPVVTDLAKYGLTNTVVVKSDGTALYMTQDLALTRHKIEEFKSDLFIWDIGMEQSLYFQQLFAVIADLGMVPKEKLFHLAHALINFKGGKKMATRRGEVVMADEILDLLQARAKEIISSSKQELRGSLNPSQLGDLAEKVALAAIKYSILKYSRETTMYFDIDESLALEGNSGPYLQYTYSRCKSVLNKANNKEDKADLQRLANYKLADEETELLRSIYRYSEIVVEATRNYAPNLICNYLYDLAQKYNLFYNKLSILKAGTQDWVNFRLGLTAAVAQVLENGLRVLGIETPERM